MREAAPAAHKGVDAMALLELLPLHLNPFVGFAGLIVALAVGMFVLKFVLKIARVVGLIGCFGILAVTLLTAIVVLERR
jgi:hypothetical protein